MGPNIHQEAWNFPYLRVRSKREISRHWRGAETPFHGAENAAGAARIRGDNRAALSRKRRQSLTRNGREATSGLALIAGRMSVRSYLVARQWPGLKRYNRTAISRHARGATFALAGSWSSYFITALSERGRQCEGRIDDALGGHPCPVCGASEHPEPAHDPGDATVLEKAWRDAQAQALAASKADRDAQSNASSAHATLEAQRAVLAGLTSPLRSVSDIEADLRNVLAEIDALGVAVDAGILAQELEAARKRRQTAAETLQQASDALGKATTAEALARQAYDDRIASVPESLREQAALQTEIDAAAADFGGRKQAVADADAKQQELTAIAIRAAADLESAATMLGDNENDLAAKGAAFGARLIELGIAETDYRAAIADIAAIADLEKAIFAFDSAQAEARARDTAARIRSGQTSNPTV